MKLYNDLVIFDLDSTLSDSRHRHHLSPFVNELSDWPTYAKASKDDPPMMGAITLCNLLWPHYGIYILTGRDIAAKQETLEWLDRHEVKYDWLKMRESSDVDDNGVYKSRHIETLKSGMGYTVHMLIDDWPSTVRQVQEAGTPTLCVNPLYVDETMSQYDNHFQEKAVGK